jgi:hypothetical protein
MVWVSDLTSATTPLEAAARPPDPTLTGAAAQS